MKNKFSFAVQSLLYATDDLKGPLVQVLFAKQLAEQEGAFHYNRLARVTFTNTAINSAFPGGVQLEETLLVGEEQSDNSTLHLCIRGKNTVCRIATGYYPHKEIILHDDYRHAILLHKLSDKEIYQIFSHVWSHPEDIQPLPFFSSF